MVAGVKKLAADWKYDVVSIGYPGPVLQATGRWRNHTISGRGWVGFDFDAAFGCPVKLINDAAMQALGSYKGGKMLFLGLGTGLGSALIVDGDRASRWSWATCPTGKGPTRTTWACADWKRLGKKKWRQHVADVVARLIAALEPDDVVLGGGNVSNLKELPPGCRVGRQRQRVPRRISPVGQAPARRQSASPPQQYCERNRMAASNEQPSTRQTGHRTTSPSVRRGRPSKPTIKKIREVASARALRGRSHSAASA